MKTPFAKKNGKHAKKKRRTFKAAWKKHINNHFFNKAFVTFFLIAALAGGLLLQLLSENLVSIKTEQTVEMSNQIIATVDGYLDDKLSAARSIHQRLILDSDSWKILCSKLEHDGTDDSSASEYTKLRQSFVQTVYSVDNQFYGLFFYSSLNEEVIRLLNDPDSGNRNFFFSWANQKEQKGSVYLLSAFSDDAHNSSYSLFAIRKIMSPNIFSQEIGLMGLTFSAMNIRQAYRRFDDYLKGPLVVLDKNGNTLYDSRSLFSLPEDFSFESVKEIADGNKRIGNHIYNVRYNSDGEYYVVNLIPTSEVQKDVRVVRQSIFTVVLAVLIAALLLTFFASRKFSRRLGKLTDTMELVRGGKLTGFTKPKQTDEIGVIHTEFIGVCESLDEQIQKEYVYQLKEKEMEFYALQAQIDPHFLYNSLETIRMKLLLSGDNEASRMVRIMSEMFRNIMKPAKVVTIREELSFLRYYLELYRYRLGEKLKYDIDVDEDVYAFATVKHILQPLVENALVHGFASIDENTGPGLINIVIGMQGSDILLTISDNGKGIEPEQLKEMQQLLESKDLFQKSVGLYNVNNRLRIIYGDDYRLNIDSNPQGTTVNLRIKAMTKKELEDYVQSFNN